MKTVSIHEAKTHLSRLVKLIKTGTEPEIVIAVGHTPAAKLVPYSGASKRKLGGDEGLISLAHDFDEPDKFIAGLFQGGT